VIIAGSVKEDYEDFFFIRGIGNIINPYDFTYGEKSKAVIRAKTSTKIMEVQADIILELLKTEPEFKKKWYKSIFMYSVHHKRSLEFLHKNFSEKQLRRFVEGADVKLMNSGDVEHVQYGGYLFDG
jgi:hypothetical protein